MRTTTKICIWVVRCPVKFQSQPPETEGEISRPAHKPIPSIKYDHLYSTSCFGYFKIMQPSDTIAGGIQSLSPYKYDFFGVGRKIFESFWKNIFRGTGRVRKDEESGKQCKAVPTLRKLPISALAETDSFMLVEAPPQSPQNTKVVFWNAG